MRKYWMEAYGCQMNLAESDAVEKMLLRRGWERAQSPEQAQAVIMNTCSVRQTAENRIWGRLGFFQYLKTRQPMVLVLTGCMAQRIPQELSERAPYIDFIVGTNGKLDLARILDCCVSPDGTVGNTRDVRLDAADCYHFAPLHYKEGDLTAYVPIMNGCNNFCAYCIVPYVRGREVSRPAPQVVQELLALDASGPAEIQLLGQNVNSYHWEDWNFARLLQTCAETLDRVLWLRFDSPHPKDFSDETIRALASSPKIARHFHIPLQSGSDRILALMNRRYTVKRYMEIIDSIRETVPGATFSTDVMVGFPTETEDDVKATRAVMEDVGFIEAFMYYFNPREGTAAVKMDGQIPEDEKIRRLQGIIDFQLANCARIKAGRIGQVQTVLVTGRPRTGETRALGKNEHGEMIDFLPRQELKAGDVVQVLFEALNGNTFTGRQV